MNEIPTYDHSKPDIEAEDKPSFYHHAAKLCFWMPILAAAFLRSVEYGLKDTKGAWVPFAAMGVGGLAVCIFLASIALGIFALFGISRHGTDKILWRSLRGIITSGILLVIFVTNFVHGYQLAAANREALEKARQASAAMREDLKKEVAEKGGIKPGTTQPRLEKIKTELDKASKEMTGDEALMTKAMSAYVGKIQIALKNYEAGAALLKTPPVLDMKGVEQREQLQPRKEAVNKFMDANEKLLGFINRGESAFREELVRLQASPSVLEKGLKGYRETMSERNYLSMKIRMTDQRIGTAMLGMLDALDTGWGNWHYSAEKKKVIFQNNAALAKYNENFKLMNAAVDEQAQLQGKLVNLPDTASAR